MFTNSLEFLSTKVYLAAANPTLSGTSTWFTGEMKTALTLIVLAVCVFFIVKQKIGMMITTIIIGAFIWFMASDPALIFDSIGNVFKTIFGA